MLIKDFLDSGTEIRTLARFNQRLGTEERDMDVTVEDVEKIKKDFDVFEEFAEMIFDTIGRPGDDFDQFCVELNRIVVELATGSDSQPELSKRLRYVFNSRVKDRVSLRRQLGQGPKNLYRSFLATVDDEHDLGLTRRGLRSLGGRHQHFIREFLSRYPLDKRK